mgnify:CR=1 FL=1
MKPLMFSKTGKFWKGNLHTHSNRSDGLLSPDDLCQRYKDEGYDFLVISNHFVGMYNYPITKTSKFTDPEFTTILGAELHSGASENGEIWHILAVGLPENFAPSNSPRFVPINDQESGPEIAERCFDAGAFVVIAHPQWSGLTLADARSITSAHAVEAYNHGCAVSTDRPDGFHTLDLLLAEGRKLNLVATDDAHFTEPDFFGGWVMVKAQQNKPGSILESLKEGSFYSSQGPDFKDIKVQNDRLEVLCSPVEKIIVSGYGSASIYKNKTSVESAVFNLGLLPQEKWLRVTIIDNKGKKAWTNPIYDY